MKIDQNIVVFIKLKNKNRPKNIKVVEKFIKDVEKIKKHQEIQGTCDGDVDIDVPVYIEEISKTIKKSIPSFHPKRFASNARAAFEMTLKALNDEDKNALRQLVEKEVLETFMEEINKRKKAGHVYETEVLKYLDIEFKNAILEGNIAYISIYFKTKQSILIKEKSGKILHERADNAEALEDTWTFSKDLKKKDNRWFVHSI